MTLDTTRADHLGAHGAPDARTPTLDALARKGTMYARALTPAPLTLPAHCSLMTGLPPSRHGVRDNGLSALPSDVPLLPTALAGRGYRTAAFVASRVLDRRFGLARGFEVYDDRMLAEALGEYGYPERDAAGVTDAAIGWLRGLDEAGSRQPYFLWVHYYDAHSPYAPPPPWRGSTPEQDYAGEISFVDRQLARLLEALPGPAAGRVIAIAGDHGEALGEHGERAHGIFLYRASLEVPLLLIGPGAAAGRVEPGLVSICGLPSALLRLLGQAEAAAAFGTGLQADGPVLSETRLPAAAYGWSPLEAASDGRWRLILAPRPELYDLLADPQELQNVHAGHPEVVRRLQGALEGRAPAREAAAVPPDPEMTAALESLGYVSAGSARTDAPPGTLIDPKDGLPMLAELEQAQQALAAGDLRSALPSFEDLVRRNPGNVRFLTHLAQAQLASGASDQALATLRKALGRQPGLEFLHLNLADAYFELQRWEEAAAEYRRVLDLDPRSARAWLGLAELASRQGRASEERRILQQAGESGTASVIVLSRLGQIELQAGDFPAADGALRQATELEPDLELPWLLWSDLAEKQGRVPEALERALRATEANPRDPGALLRAGRLSIRAGQAVQARQLLERATALAPDSEVERQARRLLEGQSPDGKTLP